jgi:midasin
MSQQSDVADLLGGFKPVDEQFVYSNLCREFMALFARTFSKKVFLILPPFQNVSHIGKKFVPTW